MPRTKDLRRITRNRQAAIREEVIREFDSKLEEFISGFDWKIKQNLREIDMEIDLLKSRIPQKMLAMRMSQLINLKVRTFADVEPTVARIEALKARRGCNQLLKRSKDDEGYLTEDSRGSGRTVTAINVSHSRLFARTNRNPRPVNSVKDSRQRRSRSACGNKTLQSKPHSVCDESHVSRQMSRTPLSRRQKAVSADRSEDNLRHDPYSPTALLRWPKPGELVLSITGSPVVAQIVPDSFANVNIPIRDGILSLRPKKLQNVDPDLVQKIDQETLGQIKLLQSNLELIMSFVHKKK